MISNKTVYDFCTMPNIVLSHMSEWFTADKLVLNLNKINIIKFITNNIIHHSMLQVLVIMESIQSQ
jgi:hypothetical protein